MNEGPIVLINASQKDTMAEMTMSGSEADMFVLSESASLLDMMF